MVNIRIYRYSDTLQVIFSMRVLSHNSGTYCMVPSDWDLALRCICGPNFRSTSLENSQVFLFVCLSVWLNKDRTVKHLRHFHSWSLNFTKDGLAFSKCAAGKIFMKQKWEGPEGSSVMHPSPWLSGEKRGPQQIWVIRRSSFRFRPKTRQLKSGWIWANRPSSKGAGILFPVIKANQIKSCAAGKIFG